MYMYMYIDNRYVYICEYIYIYTYMYEEAPQRKNFGCRLGVGNAGAKGL